MTITAQERQTLIELANAARVHSYAPYSNYLVGAALRTRSGRIYTGVNIENAAYPHCMCAERVAVFRAVADGELEFDTMALVTDNGGSPCGGCRQVLAEFGLATTLLIANGKGELLQEMTIDALLPAAFLPHDLHR